MLRWRLLIPWVALVAMGMLAVYVANNTLHNLFDDIAGSDDDESETKKPV
jgi:hypothetical protein